MLRLDFNQKIRCHEDDGDDVDAVNSDDQETKQPRSISETDMNRIMAAREKQLLGKVEKKIAGMGFATADSISDILSQLSAPSSDSGEPKKSVSEQQEALEPGVRAELSKLHKQLGKVQEENEKLRIETEAKEDAMKMERRQHSVEGLLGQFGAVRPEQCYTILKGQIVEDEEIGDAVKVKTPHGDDFVPVKEYLNTFKEDNPHLFSAPAKSGSGAGGGSVNSGNRPRFNADSLRDPKQGGLSWEEYEKNRDKIITDIESNRGNH